MENAGIITQALANIPTAISTAMDVITSNELMMFFVGIGIASACFGLFRKGKKAAR